VRVLWCVLGLLGLLAGLVRARARLVRGWDGGVWIVPHHQQVALSGRNDHRGTECQACGADPYCCARFGVFEELDRRK
jgi:hypothetical protein